MKNVDKQLGTKVRKTVSPKGIFKVSNGYLGLDAGYSYSAINLTNLGIIDRNTTFQKKVMEKVDELKKLEDYKYNEKLDNDALTDKLNFVQKYANNEGAKALNTFSKVNKATFAIKTNDIITDWAKGKNVGYNDLLNQYLMANALHVVAQSMRKELELRDKAQEKIDNAIDSQDLATMKSVEGEARTPDQKTKITTAIAKAQVIADKQKKVDELNEKLANAKTDAEKKAIANQISDLTGSVAQQFGIPKGLIYFGVGVVVILGVWVTIRAIRSNN